MRRREQNFVALRDGDEERLGLGDGLGNQRLLGDDFLVFGQPTHLQHLRDVEERRKRILADGNLAFVHELDDGRQVVELDVLENDDGVLTGVLHEGLAKVRAAHAKDDFVRPQTLPIAAERHIREEFILRAQNVERIGQMLAVRMPLQ